MEQVGKYLSEKGGSCAKKGKHSKAQHYTSMAIICYSQLPHNQQTTNVINTLYYQMGVSYLKSLDYPLGFHYYAYSLYLCPPIFPMDKQIKFDTDVNHKRVLIYSRFSDDFMLLMCRFIPKFYALHSPSEIILSIPMTLFSIMSRIPFLQQFKLIYDGQSVDFDYHIEISTLPTYAGIQTSNDMEHKHIPFIRPDKTILEKQTKMVNTYLNKNNKLVLLNLLYNGDIDKRYTNQIDEQYVQNLTEDFRNVNFLTLTPLNHRINNTLVDMSTVCFEKILAYISSVYIVVTRCSIVAHLAGCMNCKVFLVLEKNHEWIWSNPNWYKHMTIFKQTDESTWDDVFYELKKTIQEV